VSCAGIDLQGKTVLITGGAGFIGANLAMHIQQHSPECRVVVFDAFVLGHFQNLRGFRGECVAGDISVAEDLQQLAPYRFDYIFHQAAISDTTVTDQQRVVRVNTNAFRRILDLAASLSAPLVYASSAGVYGNSPAPNRVGCGEYPENVYGFSKLMMDHLARQYVAGHAVRAVGLRYFNVYGPRESYKGRMASMILQLGLQLLAGRRPRLFKHGEQKRDFVFVEDVVQANLLALGAKSSGVYNVGSGRAREFRELLQILQEALGVQRETEYIDNPWEFYQQHTEADLTQTAADLGYTPRFTLEAGIESYAAEIRRLAKRMSS
jgi:ADP-L-glycero-D-manno-heptose 6-epimerase